MPRLDNSDPWVLDIFKLDYDLEDPGMTDPVDICYRCHRMHFATFECCEHPPYDEQDPHYECAWCGYLLFDIDD